MKIAIIGFSRFGQLWAELMRPLGEVIIFNRTINDENMKIAKRLKAKLYGFDQFDRLAGADWIFLSVSIAATEETIKNIKPHVTSRSVVMDVCSVKIWPCRWLKRHLADCQIMGTHPMFGPDSAKAGLKGKQMILCPIRISAGNLSRIKQAFKKLGLKIIQTSPQQHDRDNAYSLALVHFLGRGLEQLDLEKIKITTLGFERLRQVESNVSNDSWDLFVNLHKYNPYAAAVRRKFMGHLQQIEKQIS